MRNYSSTITLDKTSRGVWGLDVVKGCKYGMQLDKNGCYGACYACSVAKRYNIDFSNSVVRRFDSKEHEKQIISKLESIDLDFIRIGVMGDPSECWGHTVEICDKIKPSGKKIVLITKHWEPIPDYLFDKISELELIINTSISALDSDDQISHRLMQYERLKSVCKSVLRVVSCAFNLDTIMGLCFNSVQNELLKNNDVIETVLRLPKSHYLIENLIIKIDMIDFLSSKQIASINGKSTHVGYCKSCPDLCGSIHKN